MGKFCWLKGARPKRSNDAGEEKKKKLRGNKLKKKRGKGEREREPEDEGEEEEEGGRNGQTSQLNCLASYQTICLG